MAENRNYRIRTQVGGEEPFVLNIPIEQSYDMLEILSLNVTDENTYKLYDCGYGIIVGRVIANGNFGVPNARVSVFIPYDGTEDAKKLERLYNFSSTNFEGGADGKVYNLLPDFVDEACHQDVGSFKSKRTVLDNNDEIEVFEKYYRYTTRTNESGDYMLYGVPTGQVTVHMDVDLSDIGVLSQTPRDMMYKGYGADLFESPTKFKKSDNLNILPQIKRYDKAVYVNPFWGDTTDISNPNNASINRLDFKIDYIFEPTCIFMGSVFTDNGSESINRNCRTTINAGKMSDLVTGGGRIEMIRFTKNGKVEQTTVKGDQIDDNGVWCYQIPMNLDYMMTDEFGKMVPTDDPDKGIPTRTKVRFRISMDDIGGETTATKRARYLVPNNPELHYYDDGREYNFEDNYEFGSFTKDEDFRDLYWNNVYTVKSFIPRLQKSKSPIDRKYTGIKMVNHSGDNNPMPYNSLSFHLGFRYRFLCFLSKMFVRLIYNINKILSPISWMFYLAAGTIRNIVAGLEVAKIFNFVLKLFCGCKKDANDDEEIDSDADDSKTKLKDCRPCRFGEMPIGEDVQKLSLCGLLFYVYENIGCGIGISGLCADGKVYYPGCWEKLFVNYRKVLAKENRVNVDDLLNTVSGLFDCIENQLAQDNEATSFNFSNDWVNGVLYFPLWHRFVRPKRTFFINGIRIPGKNRWCSHDRDVKRRKLKLYKTCSLKKEARITHGVPYINPYEKETFPEEIDDFRYTIPKGEKVIIGYNQNGFEDNNCNGYKCHKNAVSFVSDLPGIIYEKWTMLKESVYYYVAGDKDSLYNNNDIQNDQFVKMFSTDIVLLGSLHSCDLQGVPQFFKRLKSTTFNFPPDLLVSDGEINEEVEVNLDTDSEDVAIDYIDGTEYTFETGADWGSEPGYRQCYGPDWENKIKKDFSPERYADGGLFYGLTCSNAYTKPKSCVNLERICEFGVRSDIAVPIDVNGEEKILIPDGYISYDEIYDNDGRSEFVTMNSNNLRTTTEGSETGFPIYDFNNWYVDNFDGTMKNLMSNPDCKCSIYGLSDDKKANYYYNYLLENNSEAYTRFRYCDSEGNIRVLGRSTKSGNKSNNIRVAGGKIVKSTYGYISTQNSFYFYFGLKDGKTAIDRFMTDYFSVCDTDETGKNSYYMDIVANDWCDNNGYFALYLNRIDKPYSIELHAHNETNNSIPLMVLEDEKIYFGRQNQELENAGYANVNSTINNDIYTVVITDADDNEDSFTLNFIPDPITFNVQGFGNASTNEAMYEGSNPLYNSYMQAAVDNSRYTSLRGGYIVFYPPQLSGSVSVENYEVSVRPHNPDDFDDVYNNPPYNGVTFDVYGGQTTSQDQQIWNVTPPDGAAFVIGIPKNNVSYDVTVTMLCDDSDNTPTDNRLTVTVYVSEPAPLKMYVNGIDYDIIKDFRSGYTYSSGWSSFDANNVVGWDNLADIGVYQEPEEIPLNVNQPSIPDKSLCTLYVMSLFKYNTNILTCNYNWSDECYIFPEDLGFTTLESLPSIVSETLPDMVYVLDIGDFYSKQNNSSYSICNPLDYYFSFNDGDVERESIYNNIVNVVNNRKELSSAVREAFTKNGDEFDVTIGVSGGYGTKKHSIYRQYESEGTVLNHYVNETTESNVFGETVPTLEFGTLPNDISTSGRKPYLYAVSDQVNTSLPSNFDGTTILNTTPDLANMFYAHMLNKPMTYSFECWSPIVNHPLIGYNNGDGVYNLHGIFGIEIINGISTSLNQKDAFENSRIYPSDMDVKVYTALPVNPDDAPNRFSLREVESACNTKRIVKNPYIHSNFTRYTVNSDIPLIDILVQGIPLNKDQSDEFYAENYIFDDGYGEQNIQLYPDFGIFLDEDVSYVPVYQNSAQQSQNEKLVLKFNFVGYEPENVFFYSYNGSSVIEIDTYPPYTTPFNCNNTIYKWGNYNSVISNPLNVWHYVDGVSDEYVIAKNTNNYKVEVPMYNGVGNDIANNKIISGIAASRMNSGIYYSCLQIYDSSRWKITASRNTNPLGVELDIRHYGLSGDNFAGSYIKKYQFTILKYAGNNYEEYDQEPVTSFASGGTITVVLNGFHANNISGYDFYLKDVTGLKHKLNE